MNELRAAMPRALRHSLIALGITGIVAYVATAIWLRSQETTLVFRARVPFGDQRPAPPFEQVDVPPADDDPLLAGHQAVTTGNGGRRPFAWVMRVGPEPPGGPWVIFLHGNNATVASRVNIRRYERLRKLGLNVLAPEYRGFGGIDGVPSESSLGGDARAAYRFARVQLGLPARRIIIYGWSLGSAVAVDLASRVDAGAVILEGAPSSLIAIGQSRYPYFPIRLLMRNRFESILKVGRVHEPILFLHSRDDAIVPIDEGRRLFDAAREPKQFVEVDGGHVQVSEKDPRFFPAIRAFLVEQHLLPVS